VKLAIKSSEIIFFLLDARAGLTALDTHFAKWIRKCSGKLAAEEKVNGINKSREIYCLANKTEGIQLSNKVIDSLIDINSLGFGEAIPISSAHGDGMSDLVSIILQSAERRNISSSDSSSLKNSNDIKIENVPYLLNNCIRTSWPTSIDITNAIENSNNNNNSIDSPSLDSPSHFDDDNNL
jgi:predicted GTPase